MWLDAPKGKRLVHQQDMCGTANMFILNSVVVGFD